MRRQTELEGEWERERGDSSGPLALLPLAISSSLSIRLECYISTFCAERLGVGTRLGESSLDSGDHNG